MKKLFLLPFYEQILKPLDRGYFFSPDPNYFFFQRVNFGSVTLRTNSFFQETDIILQISVLLWFLLQIFAWTVLTILDRPLRNLVN